MSLSGALFVILVVITLVALGILLFTLYFFEKVQQGQALIISPINLKKAPVVTFSGGLVLPIVHKAEIIDISVKIIEIDRRGPEGLICKDNIRVDLQVSFFVRVNQTPADVLRVAQAIGCERTASQDTLATLFRAQFAEALKTVGKQFDFETLCAQRAHFRHQVIESIGTELNGYVLERVAIDYLEQTAVAHLDPENIFDAQGIRKITELTAQQHIQTNDFKNQEQMTLTQQNVQSKATLLELQRQQAEAEAQYQREIRNVQDREQAEIALIAAQERLKSESAQIQTDEKLALYEENKQRELEIAQHNRARIVHIEIERAQRAQELERIAREQELESRRMAKEHALEAQRREMAELIQQRLAMEKAVAEAEEHIQTARVIAEAERQKQATILQGEAQAHTQWILALKAAEAAYETNKWNNRAQLASAQAEREAADNLTMAKIRQAEAIQAEHAAAGLAEAKVLAERLRVEAQGEEQHGLAQLRVQRAQLELIEQRGLAEAKVKEIEAATLEKQGQAQARVVHEKILAETQGWVERFKVLDNLSDRSRAHEEFRLQLEQQLEINKLYLETQKTTVAQQTQIMAEALKHAKMDKMNGEHLLFERMANASSLAKGFEEFIKHSESQLLRQYFLKDIQEILANPALTNQDLYTLTLPDLLNKLMIISTPEQQQKLHQWLKHLHAVEPRP